MRVTTQVCLGCLCLLSVVDAFVVQNPANAHRPTTSLDARTPLIAGNWKTNPCTLQEAIDLAKAVAEASKKAKNVNVAVIPPYPFLLPVNESVGDVVMVGAQNCYFQDKGAYTGAVSNSMLASVNCKYVLCGHSERRSVFRNDDKAINAKVRAVLSHGMKPILCVGETKEEYDAGLVKAICALQLAKDLTGVTAEEMRRIVIAYEPVWAIGTGLVATPETAQSVHKYIRGYIAKMYNQEIADETVIQYGGSVTPASIAQLMAQPDIDGALVGGASLKPADFGQIINYNSL